MLIPLASQIISFVENSLSFNQLNILRADIPCVLKNGVGEAARSKLPVTLYIAVNITGSASQRWEMMSITGTKNPRFALHRSDEAMKWIVPIG